MQIQTGRLFEKTLTHKNKTMKKILTITACSIAFAITSHAQISKGTVFLGTSIGSTTYSSSNDNLDYTAGTNINKSTAAKTYGFNVGPQVGVFLSRHFLLGGTVTYNITYKTSDATTLSSVNQPVTAHSETSNYTINAGPFMRYYFYDHLSKNILYVQANATAGTGNGASSGNGVNVNSTYSSDGKVSNIFNWNAGSSIGVTHFFTPSVGMDIALGYTYTSASSGNMNSTESTNKSNSNITISQNNYNETTITNGISFGIGFHWYLNNKHHKV